MLVLFYFTTRLELSEGCYATEVVGSIRFPGILFRFIFIFGATKFT
jgi:hypothetical protein